MEVSKLKLYTEFKKYFHSTQTRIQFTSEMDEEKVLNLLTKIFKDWKQGIGFCLKRQPIANDCLVKVLGRVFREYVSDKYKPPAFLCANAAA